jgi:hypothetical protein
MLGLMNEIFARIFFLTPKLTRQIARSGYRHNRFNGEKITKVTPFRYSDLTCEIQFMVGEPKVQIINKNKNLAP